MSQSRYVVITGANRGIGLELVEEFLEKGHRVFCGCRKPQESAELKKLSGRYKNQLQIYRLDVIDDKSVLDFANKLTAPVDILVNNAGVLFDHDKNMEQLSFDHMLQTFDVNAVGPMRVFRAMLPRLKESLCPLNINISSRVGSIADNSGSGMYAYRASKTALNMLNKCLSIDYPEIISVVIHPGWVKTDMGGSEAPLSVEESVAGIIKVINKIDRHDSGKFYDYRGEELPW